MSLEHAILGYLSGEPLSGYDLKTRCFDRDLSHCWSADLAQIYRTLERLRKRRQVTSATKHQRGKPDRRVYSITPAGRDELSRWESAVVSPPPLRDPYLLQLHFADGLSDDELLSLLSEARQAYQSRLDSLRRRTREPAVAALPSSRAGVLRRMTLDAALAQARAAVDWLDDCMDRVRAGLPKEETR